MTSFIYWLIDSQRKWSLKNFGPGPRTEGNIAHIKKELDEIRANPADLTEWIDVILLALDGAWRAGYEPEEIIKELREKHLINLGRKWPEKNEYNKPVYHIKDSHD